MARSRTRRAKKGGLFGTKQTVADRPGYATSSSGTLRNVVGQKNFDRPIGPAPTISEEAQDERDVKEAVGELRAQRRLTKTAQDKFVTSKDLDTMDAVNPMYMKKAGRKTRRKSKKVMRKRK